MTDAIRDAQAAARHLQAGRFAEARELLAPLAESRSANPQLLMMHAFACRKLGEKEDCARTLDRLILMEPRMARAHLMKGDLAAEAEDVRKAVAFYRRALAEARHQRLPPDLEAEMKGAQRYIEAADRRFRELLETRIPAQERSPRFRQSLDLMFGEKEIYFQQPGLYYFPELPQIQFYERGEFGWAEELEAQAGAIRRELEGLLAERELFSPYVVSNNERPPSGYHGMVDNPDWSSVYLWSEGKRVDSIARRCPKTMAALDKVPLARLSVRAPVVMFSLLKGGARIPPHHGSTNVRLICHLPLLVPTGCALRCGNEVRSWEEGKLLVFDDTIEHEAWNESGEDRVVLIFDIWRPELTAADRTAVKRMFEVIDASE
ncbi:MAG: aspartyl/asparaginyl beta-hydroxylase domain-containing protein [Sphingomonadaceae bacterium]